MKQPNPTCLTNRRTFLKIVGLAAGSLVLSPLLSAFDTATILSSNVAKLYRGTLYGQILESLDNGASWQTVADFGKDYAILGLEQHMDGIAASLVYQGRSFALKSSDGRSWYTWDWQAPSV